ncbi:MAG: hypothetical protein AABY22_22355, partial [Nanoarchaeota archaeon]
NRQIIPDGGDGDASGVIPLPESEMAKFFTDADTQTLFNVTLHEMNELGTNQVYQVLFDEITGTAYSDPDGGGSAQFSAANDDLVIAADLTRPFAWRALSQDPESKLAAVLTPDDQFPGRADKSGYFLELEEGRVVVDGRNLHALVI